ncbi:MAG: tRNA (adenosine(37)-N6)-dimethylallyltransferase MiaA [Bacteroidia bacterium]|nr:tRNA (adenosine(37)-N6)-dimethylallyltransferase MiaA [Bacteroidia bacterium]
MVIAGPTAAGKTDLAIQLAEHFGTVILSADSRQFYKELNIGTAKPDQEQLKRVKHYFINTKNVDELYGAGHFEKDVLALLEELFKQHRFVFLVGGSGLYINAVLNGVDDFVDVPGAFRAELNQQFLKNGLVWLQNELKRKDKAYFKQVDLNNPQRMIRALEVCNYTGKTYSSFLNKNKNPRHFEAIPLLITPDRETLYKRINERVDEMMRMGLETEVKTLKEHRHQNALKTVGYKELNAYFDGEYDLKTAIEKIKQHTRNYAKRQLTWFRNQGRFKEFSPQDIQGIKNYIQNLTQ